MINPVRLTKINNSITGMKVTFCEQPELCQTTMQVGTEYWPDMTIFNLIEAIQMILLLDNNTLRVHTKLNCIVNKSLKNNLRKNP